jgi:predicted NBD/HSP70 family sugar kinase
VTIGQVVGALDIGGTHVTAGRVDVESRTVDAETRVRLALPAAGERPPLERIVAAAGGVATPKISRFGIAVPGPFDYAAGISRISHKLAGLYGIDLRRELGAALGLPGSAITFLNDAEAFLLGEWWAGAARGHTRAVGITLGTGLGSAFLERGSIVRSGPRVPTGGELYRLVFRGAPVEETISRRALLAAYDAGSESGIDMEQIAARAQAGEDRARLVFRKLATDLDEFLGPILEAFAPTCLVVGGSIAHAWALLEPALRQRLGRFQTLAVTRAANVDDAPLLGAARHAAMQDVRERVE